MGREMASAFARWCALLDTPSTPRLVAVADKNPAALEWFDRIPSASLLTADYAELLASADVDIVYVAVPHQLHEQIYTDVIKAGKDLFAEKPFGIDLGAAERIRDLARESGRFVRCSSEFPFFPGAQRVIATAKIQHPWPRAGSHRRFPSLLRPRPFGKSANWKRKSATCGEIGVLGDLGMHVCHIPLRLGWMPRSVYAQLQHGYPERPGPDGNSRRNLRHLGQRPSPHLDRRRGPGGRSPHAPRNEAPCSGANRHLVHRNTRHRGWHSLLHQGAQDSLDLRTRFRTVLEEDRPRFPDPISQRLPEASLSPAFPTSFSRCGPPFSPSVPLGDPRIFSTASLLTKQSLPRTSSQPPCARSEREVLSRLSRESPHVDLPFCD